MKKKEYDLELNAQLFLNLCIKNDISTCAVVTSLKKDVQIYNLCELLSKEMNRLGKKTAMCCEGIDFVKPLDDDILTLFFAPCPNKDIASFRMCQSCDSVVVIEKYGRTLHYSFEEMIHFLNEQNIDILGVIAVK